MSCPLCKRTYIARDSGPRDRLRAERVNELYDLGAGDYPEEICLRCVAHYLAFVKRKGGWEHSFDAYVAERAERLSYPSFLKHAVGNITCVDCGLYYRPGSRLTKRCVDCAEKHRDGYRKDQHHEWVLAHPSYHEKYKTKEGRARAALLARIRRNKNLDHYNKICTERRWRNIEEFRRKSRANYWKHREKRLVAIRAADLIRKKKLENLYAENPRKCVDCSAVLHSTPRLRRKRCQECLLRHKREYHMIWAREYKKNNLEKVRMKESARTVRRRIKRHSDRATGQGQST